MIQFWQAYFWKGLAQPPTSYGFFLDFWMFFLLPVLMERIIFFWMGWVIRRKVDELCFFFPEGCHVFFCLVWERLLFFWIVWWILWCWVMFVCTYLLEGVFSPILTIHEMLSQLKNITIWCYHRQVGHDFWSWHGLLRGGPPENPPRETHENVLQIIGDPYFIPPFNNDCAPGRLLPVTRCCKYRVITPLIGVESPKLHPGRLTAGT